MRNALIIGGDSVVARLTVPKLRTAGFAVTSVFRDKDRVGEILALGAAPVIQDISRADTQTWRTLMSGMDRVLWAGDETPQSSPEAERESAICLIDTVADVPNAPRLLFLSATSQTAVQAVADPSLEPWHRARQEVDDYFCTRALDDALLIGPGGFNDDGDCGIRLIDAAATPPRPGHPASTSRELAARVLAEMADREDLPVRGRIDFINGHGDLKAL